MTFISYQKNPSFMTDFFLDIHIMIHLLKCYKIYNVAKTRILTETCSFIINFNEECV